MAINGSIASGSGSGRGQEQGGDHLDGCSSSAQDQIQLRWTSHQPTIFNIFQSLYNMENLVDVTLAAEGKFLKAHKIILSACSPYFQELLSSPESGSKQTIIFMSPETKFKELKALLNYMYKGETRIHPQDLPSLLRLAEALQIRGLAESSEGDKNSNSTTTSTNVRIPESDPLAEEESGSSSNSNSLESRSQQMPEVPLPLTQTSINFQVPSPTTSGLRQAKQKQQSQQPESSSSSSRISSTKYNINDSISLCNQSIPNLMMTNDLLSFNPIPVVNLMDVSAPNLNKKRRRDQDPQVLPFTNIMIDEHQHQEGLKYETRGFSEEDVNITDISHNDPTEHGFTGVEHPMTLDGSEFKQEPEEIQIQAGMFYESLSMLGGEDSVGGEEYEDDDVDEVEDMEQSKSEMLNLRGHASGSQFRGSGPSKSARSQSSRSEDFGLLKGLGPGPRRYRQVINWEFRRSFQNVNEALAFICADWGILRTNDPTNGKTVTYYCKHHGRHCSAKAKLVHPIDQGPIQYYEAGVANHSLEEWVVQLSSEVKKVVLELLNLGVRHPNEILQEIKERGLEVPDMKKLRIFLNYEINKKKTL